MLLGSVSILFSAQAPFPNKISCFVRTCVSSDNSFFAVRQEPSFRPWKGSPFLPHNVWGLCICDQHVVTILQLCGSLSFYRKTQRYASNCYVYSLRRNQAPSAHYYFFLHSLSPLINMGTSSPSGTLGRSRRLKAFSHKQKIGDVKQLLHLRGVQSPAWF